jgi:ABC-type transport system substrate-binding protein
MKKRILSLVLAILMITALAGCGGTTNPASATTNDVTSAPTTSAPAGMGAAAAGTSSADSSHVNADGKTFINVAIDQDPGTFDPAVFGSPMGLEATSYSLREALFERDLSGNLIPQIGKSWKVDADNLTYHVEIYDNVTDSAGNKITADDVVFCYNRAKENAFNATSLYDSCTKDDDTHVTIKINSTSVGTFVQVSTVIMLYSKKAYEDAKGDFGTKPVFSGPYKLTDWKVGTSLTFEKRSDYWQKESERSTYEVGNVDIINYYVIQDPTQVSIALQNGSIDMCGSLDPTLAADYMPGGKISGFNVDQYTDVLSQVMYLNLNDKSILSKDLNLRQAIMCCIDIDGLIQGVVNGNGVACKTFGNATISDYQKQWDSENYFNYDAAAAKDFLSKSGYKGQKLVILTNNRGMHTSEAQIVQGYLSAIGINATISGLEDAMFNTSKNDPTQWDIMLDQCAWSGPIVAKWRDQFFKYPNKSGNICNIVDDQYYKLLKAACDVTSYSAENVNAFHQYMKDNAYARGLFNMKAFCVTDKYVKKALIHRSGFLFPAGSTYVWSKE